LKPAIAMDQSYGLEQHAALVVLSQTTQTTLTNAMRGISFHQMYSYFYSV
jgi:hypothetical protein